LVGHSWVVVDYTISPKEAWIREKCVERGYATSDRFLIIVLYGDHNPTTIQSSVVKEGLWSSKARHFLERKMT